MGSLGTFTKGAPLSKADISETGFPFILYGELYTTYKEVTYHVYRQTDANAPKECFSNIGDVIIPTSGETPEEIATATCVMVPNVILGGDLNIYRNNAVDGRIISYIINHKINKCIAKVAQGKSVVHIKADDLSKMNIKYPEKDEQAKIINFLWLIDKRIEKQRQLVESLKKYKRGYLKALIKKLNTTEFLLENIVEEYQNKTILNMQYPILSSTMNGIKLQDDYFNKQAASENTIGYKIVPKGYFTYRSMSDTGVFRFNRQMLVGNGIVSPAYPVFKVKSEEANPIFVEYMLNEDDKIKEQLLTQKEGGTRYALSFSKFKSLKINLPDINIQEKIAIQITLLNTLVKKQEAYLHCLNKNKCGLLQQMFI